MRLYSNNFQNNNIDGNQKQKSISDKGENA